MFIHITFSRINEKMQQIITCVLLASSLSQVMVFFYVLTLDGVVNPATTSSTGKILLEICQMKKKIRQNMFMHKYKYASFIFQPFNITLQIEEIITDSPDIYGPQSPLQSLLFLHSCLFSAFTYLSSHDISFF